MGDKMNFGLIKDSENPNKKRINRIIITVVIVAILFLAFGNFGDEEDKSVEEANSSFDLNTYKEKLEEEAENALSQIKGAGDVKVVLSFDSTGKTVVARNSQSKTEKDTGDTDNKERKEVTDNVVVYGQGQNEKPYITEEKMPLPSGVLVIAKGAENETVQYELYEAVKALYGISSHRIKVTASKK